VSKSQPLSSSDLEMATIWSLDFKNENLILSYPFAIFNLNPSYSIDYYLEMVQDRRMTNR
jgi:hypothetical protein